MDYLPHAIEIFVQGNFRSFQALLAQVNGVGEDSARLLDALRISAFLHLDAFGFQEAA